MTDQQNLVIDASPTKEFFIYMLTKDIGLVRSIIDLVDNCVDGALKLGPGQHYGDLAIRLEVDATHFRIADNCGGIPVDIARNYAFRFGRPADMPRLAHSVGQFGVGMKRAIFKLGTAFRIESATATSRFVVQDDVNDWQIREEWEFRFNELKEGVEVPVSERGTAVTVTALHQTVAESFALEEFRNRLREEIQHAHQQVLDKGLSVSLNGLPLRMRPLELLHSDKLRPAYLEKKVPRNGTEVQVKLYAGVAQSEPSAAGWYVYCNGRMLMGADQTYITGWGEGAGKTIPKYHNQFARFRGFAFFDSDDARALPWNTTKTGVDMDSPIFRAVRLEMVTMMRPVIDFLNRLDAEHQAEESDHMPLTDAVQSALSVRVSEVQTSQHFLAPRPSPRPPLPRTGRIQYSRPVDQINRIKEVLRVPTLRQVGEETFDYFYEREC